MARRNVTRGTPPRLAQPRQRWSAAGSTGARPRRSAKEGGDNDSESFLGVYFREMAQLGVMTPKEELRAAVRIAKLRVEYWKALMSYPPFITGIVDLVADSLDNDDLPGTELQAMNAAARALRDRDTRVNKHAYLAACCELAEKLAYVDVDGIVSDLVAADLETLDAGHREGLSIAVRPPRIGSRPFASYVLRVRRTRAMLHAAKAAFVKANLRLVVSIARRFNHGRMPLQDLIQEGNIGLMKAVDRFDHRKGFRFSTYGSWWI